jgi:enoyl-CoA hydratase/carnithine racemase
MSDTGSGGTITGGRQGGVDFIELHNPAKRHALTRDMFLLLERRLHAADVDDEARVIVIRSEGPVFCAGLDLREFAAGRAEVPDSVADLNRMLDTSAAVCGAIAESRKPVIVAAQGPCIGIGMLMFLSCDIGFMTASSRLQLPRALLGAGYFAPLLAKLLGPRRAKALLLNPAIAAIEPDDAERWGLAAGVLPGEGFREAVADYAQQLALLPAGWLQLQKAGADHISASLSVREAIRAGAQLDAIAHAAEFARAAARNSPGHPAGSETGLAGGERGQRTGDDLRRGSLAAAWNPCRAIPARIEAHQAGMEAART